MTKKEVDFETWFELLCTNLSEKGITFNDSESVLVDYTNGRDLFDIVDEIVDELL